MGIVKPSIKPLGFDTAIYMAKVASYKYPPEKIRMATALVDKQVYSKCSSPAVKTHVWVEVETEDGWFPLDFDANMHVMPCKYSSFTYNMKADRYEKADEYIEKNDNKNKRERILRYINYERIGECHTSKGQEDQN